MKYISTSIASSSSSVDITGFTSTYDEYEIHFIDVVPSTDAVNLDMRLSVDGGSTYDSTGTNYKFGSMLHYSNAFDGEVNLDSGSYIRLGGDIGNSTGEQVSGKIRLHNIHSDKYKTIEYNTFAYTQNVFAATTWGIGVYKSTSPIGGVRIYMDSGNITSGSFILYGIEKTEILSGSYQKLTNLTEDTTALPTDLLYLVDGVGGTPASKKISVENFKNSIDIASKIYLNSNYK